MGTCFFFLGCYPCVFAWLYGESVREKPWDFRCFVDFVVPPCGPAGVSQASSEGLSPGRKWWIHHQNGDMDVSENRELPFTGRNEDEGIWGYFGYKQFSDPNWTRQVGRRTTLWGWITYPWKRLRGFRLKRLNGLFKVIQLPSGELT